MAASVLSTGCSDWLDINHNPNYPEQVPTEQMLPGIEVGAAYTVMSWDFLFYAGVLNQYITQKPGASQFKEVEQFHKVECEITYRNIFTSQLLEAKSLKESKNENSLYAAISELMSIYDWQVAVDTWGALPYSEALNPLILEPKFDDDKAIYADLLKRIDVVINNFASNYYVSDIPSNLDYIFGGDAEAWAQFANSLKLRMMLRLVNTNMTDYASIKAFADGAKFIETTAMLSENVWEQKSGKMYPLDEYENGQFATLNVVPSASIVKYMESDSRLAMVFTKVEDAFAPVVQGAYDPESSSAKYSKLVPAKKHIPLISTWEIYFDLAEVALMTGDNAKAKTYYEKAVDESFAYWGLSAENAKSEVYDGESAYAALSGDKDADFKTINLQRWASFLMTQHSEGLFNRLRSGYPEYAPEAELADLKANFPVGSLTWPICKVSTTEPFASMAYPQDYVLALNHNANPQKKDMAVKLFWQKGFTK